MKYLITTLLAAITFQAATAQDFIGGLRSGIGKNMDASEFCKGDMFFSWNNEGYIRYETKGRFAFEVRAGHYNFKDASEYKPGILEFLPSELSYPEPIIAVNVRTDNYYMALSTQYDITCPAMKEHCPIMKNIKSFVGVDIAGMYINELNNIEDGGTGDVLRQVNNPRCNMQFGISHTLQYQLTEQLNINSSVRMMVSPYDFAEFNTNKSSQMNFMLGAGYNF